MQTSLNTPFLNISRPPLPMGPPMVTNAQRANAAILSKLKTQWNDMKNNKNKQNTRLQFNERLRTAITNTNRIQVYTEAIKHLKNKQTLLANQTNKSLLEWSVNPLWQGVNANRLNTEFNSIRSPVEKVVEQVVSANNAMQLRGINKSTITKVNNANIKYNIVLEELQLLNPNVNIKNMLTNYIVKTYKINNNGLVVKQVNNRSVRQNSFVTPNGQAGRDFGQRVKNRLVGAFKRNPNRQAGNGQRTSRGVGQRVKNRLVGVGQRFTSYFQPTRRSSNYIPISQNNSNEHTPLLVKR